jgi:hypothetical protein
MALQDLAGWVASALVLATFSARTMVPLRALAVASNVAFIGYAYMAGLWPILLLHSLMLPMNTVRLAQGSAGRTPMPAGITRDRVAAIAANDNQDITAVTESSALAGG